MLYIILTIGTMNYLIKKNKSKFLSLLYCLAVLIWFSERLVPLYPLYQQFQEKQSYAKNQDEIITLHNVCTAYEENNKQCISYEAKDVDISTLSRVDCFFAYSDNGKKYEMFLTFYFDGQKEISFTVEKRIEKDEEDDYLRSFFKGYEVFYLWADEETMRKRLFIRGYQKLYAYRLDIDTIQASNLFYKLIKRSNALYASQEYFSPLRHSSGDVIIKYIELVSNVSLPWWYRILEGERIEHLLYEQGLFNQELSFESLREKAKISL